MRTGVYYWGLVFTFFLVFSGCGNAQNQEAFDFGDLQDPSFPTLSNSTSSRVPGRVGPFHADITQEWIGFGISTTTTLEPEALTVNQDQDDGFVRLLQPVVGAQDSRVVLVTVPVTVAPDADGTLRYLNVAADFDRSESFERYAVGERFQEEWIVVNLAVSIPPGRTELVSSPYVIVDNGAYTGLVCTRATLTTVPIDPAIFVDQGGWDGSGPNGGFARGETEDHCPTVQEFEWHPQGTGVFIPPATPFPGELIPIPKPPVIVPPNKRPPFIEPDPNPKRKKLPPQDPPGEDPEEDKTPRQEAVFTEVLKRNNYIPRDQGVDVPPIKTGTQRMCSHHHGQLR